MKATPKGNRLHIGIFGRRNVGKSSLLNAMTRQEVSIVSETAGTTTDPVEKPMEILPIGPVLFIDTAGVDDIGALGEKRILRTHKILDRTDVALLILEPGIWNAFEDSLVQEFKERKIPFIGVINKVDLFPEDPEMIARLQKARAPIVRMVATKGVGIIELREALIDITPEEYLNPPPLLADLIEPGELVILVVPIDYEAPKGRIILPQVQTIREILDSDAMSMVVKERELPDAINLLKKAARSGFNRFPGFQGGGQEHAAFYSHVFLFHCICQKTREICPLFIHGARSIAKLKPGDRILIAEACSHHPIKDDIGREKIPRWLQEESRGGELIFDNIQGHDFPDDLTPYDLVICCGSCMVNRKEVLTRIAKCVNQDTPISNYGLVIALLPWML